jgi:PAS domain S-box-containing protein
MSKAAAPKTFDSSFLLAAIVESSSDVIFATSLDGTILTWNRAASFVYGYATDEAVGKSLTFLFPEDRREEIKGVLEKIGAGEPVDRHVTIGARQNGDRLRVALSVSPIFSPDSEIIAVSVIARDITARLEAADARLQAAEDAEKAKTSLIGTVSHELRTPLAAIRGYISTILEYGERLSEAEKHGYLKSVDDAAQHLERIVADLLTLSRLDAGILDLSPEVIDVGELLHEVTLRQYLSAEERPISLSLPDQEIKAQIDSFRIRQVLTNLLDNAMKYSPAGSTIDVTTCGVGDGALEIVVRDHGPGVPANELDSIFESFYRVPTPSTARVKGAGLGLAICRAIVSAHGGRIWASLPPDGGLQITIRLPKVLPEPAGRSA